MRCAVLNKNAMGVTRGRRISFTRDLRSTCGLSGILLGKSQDFYRLHLQGLGSKRKTIFKMADSEELDCSGSPNETDDIENRLVDDCRLFMFQKHSTN